MVGVIVLQLRRSPPDICGGFAAWIDRPVHDGLSSASAPPHSLHCSRSADAALRPVPFGHPVSPSAFPSFPGPDAALIGATGYVGQNLRHQGEYAGLFHSRNIHEIGARLWRTVVCAGAAPPTPGWLASVCLIYENLLIAKGGFAGKLGG